MGGVPAGDGEREPLRVLSLSGGGLVDLVRVEPAALPIVPIGGPGLVENRARVGETSSGKGKKGLFREVPSSAPLGAWSPGTEALAGAPMEGNVSLRGEVPVTVSSVAPELRARRCELCTESWDGLAS